MNYVYFFGFTNGKPFIPEIHNHTFSNTHSVLLREVKQAILH